MAGSPGATASVLEPLGKLAEDKLLDQVSGTGARGDARRERETVRESGKREEDSETKSRRRTGAPLRGSANVIFGRAHGHARRACGATRGGLVRLARALTAAARAC